MLLGRIMVHTLMHPSPHTLHLASQQARVLDAVFCPDLHAAVTAAWGVSEPLSAATWIQYNAMLVSAHERLLPMGLELWSLFVRLALPQLAALTATLNGQDDTLARAVAREVDVILCTIRDAVPRARRHGLVDEPTRAALLQHCTDALLACRWTQLHSSAAGMALAILLEPAQAASFVSSFVAREDYDLGARLALCRGIANSYTAPNAVEVMCIHVWPFVRIHCERAPSRTSTTNRHHAVAALDAFARCPVMCNALSIFGGSQQRLLDELLFPLADLTALNFDTSFHAQIDSGMRAALELIEPRKGVSSNLFSVFVTPLPKTTPRPLSLCACGTAVHRHCWDLSSRRCVCGVLW